MSSLILSQKDLCCPDPLLFTMSHGCCCTANTLSTSSYKEAISKLLDCCKKTELQCFYISLCKIYYHYQSSFLQRRILVHINVVCNLPMFFHWRCLLSLRRGNVIRCLRCISFCVHIRTTVCRKCVINIRTSPTV